LARFASFSYEKDNLELGVSEILTAGQGTGFVQLSGYMASALAQAHNGSLGRSRKAESSLAAARAKMPMFGILQRSVAMLNM